MPHITWTEDANAAGELAEIYRAYMQTRPDRTQMPGILKCFSHRPDVLQQVIQLSNTLHFSDGHLTWRMKEMIATLVSAWNQCPYCRDSHAYFLQLQGTPEEITAALRNRDIDSAPVTEPERVLLRFVERVTDGGHQVTAESTQQLRDVGWTDPQIAEAVYVTALFAFFNRVANAFGLEDAGYPLPPVSESSA